MVAGCWVFSKPISVVFVILYQQQQQQQKIVKKTLCVLLCLGPDLRNGFLGVCGHWHRLHRPNAPSWPLSGVLSLLRQLWRQDATGADVVHRLSQEGSLLEHIRHHGHYPVSVCTCVPLCGGLRSFSAMMLYLKEREASAVFVL